MHIIFVIRNFLLFEIRNNKKISCIIKNITSWLIVKFEKIFLNSIDYTYPYFELPKILFYINIFINKNFIFIFIIFNIISIIIIIIYNNINKIIYWYVGN